MDKKSSVEETLSRLSKGDIVRMTVDKKARIPRSDVDREELRLRVHNLPHIPPRGVTVFWDAKADLENNNAEDLIKGDEDYIQVNLQAADMVRDYHYEIRDIMSDNLDGAGVIDIEVL